MHSLLMHLANAIRLVRKWLLRFVLVGGLVALNLTTLMVGEVYDFMSQKLWGVMAQVSDVAAQKRPKSRAELESEARKARVEADGAKAETATTRARLETVEARNRKLELDLQGKERRLADLEADAARSIQNKRRVTETVTTLRGRVVASIRRNSSSELAEMFPVVGYLFAVGSLAYDVNDACQQLEDLESLERSLTGSDAVAREKEAICLQSFEQLVSMFTGKDPGYAACIRDRLNTRELRPPSCAGYDDALPRISDDTVGPTTEAPDLPRIE